MSEIIFMGNRTKTSGTLPSKGTVLPAFTLVDTNLEEVNLDTFSGKKVLNIFPSIDTPVCAVSVRTFNKNAGQMNNVKVLNISMDLPFAHKRFCGAEGLEGVLSLSCFRSSFAKDYGLEIEEGLLAGLCSRVVIVADEQNQIVYSEQVPDIGQEPAYEKALAALK